MTVIRLEPPYRDRVGRLRARLREESLDGILVWEPPSVRYVSGFQSTFALGVIDARKATLVTDGRYREAAEKQLTGWEIVCVPSRGLDAWWKRFWGERKYKRLGFEGSASWDQVIQWSRQVRPAQLKEAGRLIRVLRRIKDAGELSAIRKAARLADEVMERVLEFLQPGMREEEVSRHIRHLADLVGAEGESFPNIVASGPNSSRPHHHAGTRKLRSGDFVIVDLGVVWGGYCSDITRTVALGSCSDRMQEAYAECLRAQKAAVKAVQAGVPAHAVDAVAREALKHAGLEEYFTHGLGHGVGLEIHEEPALNARSKAVLEEGMTITIEPGVYLPGKFGIRIEDLVVVGAKNARVLSKTPKELRIL
jgi:Xaa-Pro aminopeptidase